MEGSIECEVSTPKCGSVTGCLTASTLSDYCKNNNINKPYDSSLIIDTEEFNAVVEKLR